MAKEAFDDAIIALKEALDRAKKDAEFQMVVSSKDEVIAKYQPIFQYENIRKLDRKVFCEFLKFENNKQLKSYDKLAKEITKDIYELRQVFKGFLDRSKNRFDRFEYAFPNEKQKIKGLDKNVLTTILQITEPDKYGIWSASAEYVIKEFDLWPDGGDTVLLKHILVNLMLGSLSEELVIDKWTLNALFEFIYREEIQKSNEVDFTNSGYSSSSLTNNGNFELEKHLQDFLAGNWDNLKEFGQWEIHKEDGATVGVEYIAGNIGRIDILASHKTEDRWLVIELKKDKTSDETLGQIQRYIGWVSENLASSDNQVEGLIIAGDYSEKLKYALKASQNIKLMTYQIQFELKPENI